MSLKSVLKKIFSIPMLLVYLLVYVFRFPIMIFLLSLYADNFSYGKAFTERLIGEFYFTQSRHFDNLAKAHFDISLLLYTEELNKTSDIKLKGQIEALIGSQYDCGKGVTANAPMARQWYKAAVAHGNQEAQKALQELEARVLEGKDNGQCYAPL
jgi:hypothetical protein